jgi:hypothetical protein
VLSSSADIIDLLGIADDDNTEEVFFKALEHASFWIEIFNAEGSNDHIKTLQTHEPCLKVASSIASMQNILKSFHNVNCKSEKENSIISNYNNFQDHIFALLFISIPFFYFMV